MGKRTTDSRGFTLIAALLLTLLLSAMAVGLLYLVNNEQRMGNNDLEGNVAYYGAEAGIENLTSQLSQLYQQSSTPSAADIAALSNAANYPTALTGSTITGVNYPAYSVTWPSATANGTACPTPGSCSTWDIVGSGQNQGMVASLIPFTLTVTAQRQSSAGQVGTNTLAATGAAITLTRTVEVGLLPAFEFGLFCDGDCDYFAGPNFNFGGRVHTNGSLFLASESSLTFTDKIAAVNQVVLDRLENGFVTAGTYGSPIYMPTAAGACPNAPLAGPAAGCNALGEGSWTGAAFPGPGPANNNAPTKWNTVSTGNPPSGFNSFITTGATGATKLQLPFMQSDSIGAIEIIRRQQLSDKPLLASARLYNEAAIRILLADTEKDLTPERGILADGQDVQIGATTAAGAIPFATLPNTIVENGVTAGNMYFATAKVGPGNWTAQQPTGCAAATSWPLFGQVTSSAPSPFCSGAWLRVEYWNSTTSTWTGITTQWLGYGFGRGYDYPPTHPYNSSTATAPFCPNNFIPSSTATYPAGQCQNPISPAILILQQLQSGLTPPSTYATGAASTANNWIPINLYDSREGEPRDSRPPGDTGANCSPGGIMNVVELDVGNLWLWLQGSGPYGTGSGKSVSTTNQNGTVENGYIVYFLDHRGMLPDAHPFPGIGFYNGFSGMSGLNDVVNSKSAIGLPDGVPEPITDYAAATPTPYSPEDTAVKGTTVLGGGVDNWGEPNLGSGFGLSNAVKGEPYYLSGTTGNAVQCYAASSGTPTAEWNMVTGPRHALRLVDAAMDSKGNSYLPPTGAATLPNGQVCTGTCGFTVASEDPVYVYGDYNTGSADTFWPSENTTTTPHSAAAIIADTVTLLSNAPSKASLPTAYVGWYDQESFLSPGNMGGRPGNTSYYRMAIASGKSIPFPEPAFAAANNPPWNDFGTDGGMHNFLRYLENRGGTQVNYGGSMISMYYSQYATGIFKCCNAVYSPPTRNYFFDTQFLNPNNLPPGTPMFQDVVSLSSHESFTPQ